MVDEFSTNKKTAMTLARLVAIERKDDSKPSVCARQSSSWYQPALRQKQGSITAALTKAHTVLQMENLALPHQLVVLR